MANSNKVKPDVPSDIFQYAIHFIFAIIIATSFEKASELLIPLNSVIDNVSSFTVSATLFLVYFIIISGWIGYTRSIVKKPHLDNFLGVIRFVLDLFILFLFFYLLEIVNTQHFQSQFHWVILTIFVIFSIWDFVKLNEHKRKKDKTEIKKRGKRTIVITFGVVAISVVYESLLRLEENPFSNPNYQILFFTAFMFAINLFYRIWKWNSSDQKKLLPKKK